MNSVNITSERLISLYANRSQKQGTDITVADFLDGIKNGPEWKAQTEAVRQHQKGSTAYDEAKGKASCATLSGTFRIDKKAENLQACSGLIAMDFDCLSDVEAEKKRLYADAYTYACFKSIGGSGLCVLVKIQPEKFADAFTSLERYYLNTYGLVVDGQCKNVNRLRYVSHDENIFVNEQSLLWNKYLPAKEKKRYTAKPGAYVHTKNDVDFVINQIHERGIDLTSSYENWYRIGFALISEYSEAARNYFHQVSELHPDYRPDDCDKVFDYLLRYGSREIKIATFYYLAKQAGLQIMCPKTQQIAKVAAMYKRGSSDVKSVIDHLQKMDGIAPELSEPIVKQVFASHIEISAEDTIYDELDTYFRVKLLLRRNEVTRRVEDENGREWEENHFNSAYIEAYKIVGERLKYPDFERFIKSDFIPTYNPIRNFFRENAHRNPTGCIDALAEAITTDTGYVSVTKLDALYVRHFLRKFLIGLVATAFGEHCPLVMVLTGPQGTGKTEFWRRLLPRELFRYYAETKFDAGKDDEILMCKKWLLCNDEFGGQTMREAKKFKDLTSKQVFTVREPYGRASADLPRLAILCGTSNELDVINDPTGNRRIIPINVLAIDHAKYNAIDKTDLLMEAYHAWRNGETHHLCGEDIARLNRFTEGFEAISDERELIELHFIPASENDPNARCLGTIEVKVILERCTNQRLGSKKLGQELAKFTGKNSKQYWVNGENKRGFWLVDKKHSINS